MQSESVELNKDSLKDVQLKQAEELHRTIQIMAKCANPLATIAQRSHDDACLMEIDFRKLRQESERLQRKIDETKAESSRLLYPMTEELSHLDGRIEKMEAAINLAKQRLHVMDQEYNEHYLNQIIQQNQEDASDNENKRDTMKSLWEFADSSDDETSATKKASKSLLTVFQHGIIMNGHHGESGPCSSKGHSKPSQQPLQRGRNQGKLKEEAVPPKPVHRGDIQNVTRNRPVARVSVPVTRKRHQQRLEDHDSTHIAPTENQIDIKPAWWD